MFFSLAVVAILIFQSAGFAADPLRLTTDGSFKQHLTWSPDGKQFLFTRIHEGKMSLWTMTSSGKDLKRLLPNHVMPHFDGSWSHDGKRIVYVYDELQGTDGKLRIHTCLADGSNDKTLIPHKAFEESPRFSPDDKFILWVSTRDGNPELYTVNDKGEQQVRLTNEITSDLHPAWSPDGKTIVFSSSRSGRQKIYRMNADGSEIRKLTTGDYLDHWPTFRSDGKWIAYVSRKSGNADIWVMKPDGSEQRNLTSNFAQDTSPAWSPDGKSIAFVSTRDGGSDIYQLTFDQH